VGRFCDSKPPINAQHQNNQIKNARESPCWWLVQGSIYGLLVVVALTSDAPTSNSKNSFTISDHDVDADKKH